jgi:hypothetical protein
MGSEVSNWQTYLSHVSGQLVSVFSGFPRQIFGDVDVGASQKLRLGKNFLAIFPVVLNKIEIYFALFCF